MADPSDITLIENAIHNPDEPRHFMQLVPATSRRIATANGKIVADSEHATIVKEVGRGVYDPVVYFPRSDVQMDALDPIDRTTHCPLKGDTEYFDVVVGDDRIEAGAWSYVKMRLGDALKDLVAFDTRQIEVTAPR